MSKIQNILRVAANEKICPKFYQLSFAAPAAVIKSIKPGQFIHIRVNDGLEPFFRRPFSVYQANKYISILYEPIGRGTKTLATKKKGDVMDVLGPLGNVFAMPPKGTKQVVMVGGGIGVAPFLLLSQALQRQRGQSPKRDSPLSLVLLYGGRTRGHVFPMKEFKQAGVKIHVATDDGSAGVKGRVSNLYSNIKPDPKTTIVYTCGPHAMMASVQEFARKNNLRGQACCEEVMACALGACLGCSIQTTSGYKTTCYDGPIFDLQEVIF